MGKYIEIRSTHVLLAIAGIALLVAVHALVSSLPILSNQQAQDAMHPKMTGMSLSSFDRELAKQFMDKNGDGRCDACGMPVGQLQCSMDPKSTIGILGSQHVHADFKVYVNGNSIDFNKKEYFMKSSFMHVDPSPDNDEASGTLHMHATGVPL